MSKPVITTFSYHYRKKYAQPVGKIALDIGGTCPNRAKGGCIFCRPASFSPGYLKKNENIAEQLSKGKQHFLTNRFDKFLAYFQQETTTALPPDRLMPAFEAVLQDKDCLGLIISTRPDCVEKPFLDELSGLVGSFAKECLIELGLQSIHPTSLAYLNRNHSLHDFTNALRRIQEKECFEAGVHLIFGIPGESQEDMLTTVKEVVKLGVQAMKFHHLQVIRDTPLEKSYNLGELRLFTQQEYSDFLVQALRLIPPEIVMHRLWSTAHPDLLIAPKWNILTTKLSMMLQQSMEDLGVRQGDMVGLPRQAIEQNRFL